MSPTQTGAKPYYYVPPPSYWPVTGSFALLLMAFGAACWFNSYPVGPWLVLAGFAFLLTMMFGWFGRVIDESEHRLYNKKVDVSFRWGMTWFIFSEVMFFAAFFGALFYARQLALPWLSGEGAKQMTNLLLWKGFEGGWPSNGPAAGGSSITVTRQIHRCPGRSACRRAAGFRMPGRPKFPAVATDAT